ncbi:MAG: OmpA family protein [Campylobacterales bacterium]|nr:OmpA family protein [Campylobacterales bacterium]
MMSGLMLVFLFIAIGFMIEVESEKKQMEDVAKSYRDDKVNLNEAIYEEFENDLEKWEATVTKDNRIVFHSPKVLFEINQSKIKDEFKTVLEEFFPRFLSIITAKEFKDEIVEILIEGHTSDEWGKSSSKEEIYLKNMELSQKRAFKVLSYCYSLESKRVINNRDWIEKTFRANGMAFAKLEDREKARRVEFVVRLKSEEKLYKILK